MLRGIKHRTVQQDIKLSPHIVHPLTGCGTKLGSWTSMSCSLVFTAPCKQMPEGDRSTW